MSVWGVRGEEREFFLQYAETYIPTLSGYVSFCIANHTLEQH